MGTLQSRPALSARLRRSPGIRRGTDAQPGSVSRRPLSVLLVLCLVLLGALVIAEPALATGEASVTAHLNSDGTDTATIKNTSTAGEAITNVHANLNTGTPTVTAVSSMPSGPWSTGTEIGNPPNTFDGGPTLPTGATLTVTIATNPSSYVGTISFTFTITGGGTFSVNTVPVTSGCPTITIAPSSLPAATVGSLYNQTLSATPAGSYTFSVSTGSLPPGLALSSTGVISGTPTTTDSPTFIVTATQGSCSGTQGYTITVNGQSGGAGPGYDIQMDAKTVAGAQAGSRFPISVIVANRGTVASPPTTLEITPASTAADNYLLRLVGGGGFPTAIFTLPIPSLPPTGVHRYTLTTVPLSSETGPATFHAAILGDGDPADDSPTAAGEDSANTTAQIVDTGASQATSPCQTAKRASATTSACTLPRGRARLFSGTASGHVKHVQIAVEQIGHAAHPARAQRQCKALAGHSGRLSSRAANRGVCTDLRWLTAQGTKHWRYKLRRSLPPGHYLLYTRPVTPIGTPVAGFTAARHDRIEFSVR